MDAALAPRLSPGDQDREIASTVRRERGRLLAFIRASIADAAEAEDLLQEALYELVRAYRLMQPVEQAGAWLRRVARNRIIDRFRRKRVERRAAGAAESEAAAPRAAEDEGSLEPVLEDLLPAPDRGPESAVMREVLLRDRGGARGAAAGAARGIHSARDRGRQLQGAGGALGSGSQHAALAQALRGALSAGAAASRLGRVAAGLPAE